jgi:hypothetical protein
MALKPYNIKDFKVVINGILFDGAGESSKFEYEDDEDNFSMKRDAEGNVSRSDMNIRSGVLKIFTMSDSPFNDVLDGLFQLDKTTGEGIFPVSITSPKHSGRLVCDQCYISKRPPFKGMQEVEEIEWEVVVTDNTDVSIGSIRV